MPPTHPVRSALTSWRTLSVSLLSFSSGLPLGLVWIAIPDWMRKSGIDIRIIGLFTLTQAPWMFKILWSPLMDRFVPPWLGRRRGWIAIAQVALAALTLLLAGVGGEPDALWVLFALAGAIAFASASQDIVLDAYAVEVLEREEQGIAVGARTAAYRAAMYVAGALSITLAAQLSWPAVNALLAALYLPMLWVTLRAPEAESRIEPPRSLREAVWEPFLGLLGRHRALEILAFVFFYKLADQLAQSLQRPFLVDMGYSDFDRGVALGTVGLIGMVGGSFLGGMLTTWFGLGHSLWIFGFLQIFSNVGFIMISQSEVSRPLMYGAMGFESLASGLGMGAFGVLLLRMTQKRFSATQYALFSSLFGLPRLLAGPITGVIVHALGWTVFFWTTLAAGIPGLVLLARFVPPGTREPQFEVRPALGRRVLVPRELALRGIVGGLLAFALALVSMAVLNGFEGFSEEPALPFALLDRLSELLRPSTVSHSITLFGSAVFGIASGLFTAAALAARDRVG